MIKKINTIKGDFFGGVIASIIAFPQALAFGVASGLGAVAGIWGAIVLSFVGAILGLNCPIISGPTGPSAIIIANIYALMNGDISSVFLILAFSAIIQMIISITSIPSLIKYIPYPVISGFLSGIGIIIIILQISPILGGQNYSSVIETLKNVPLCIQNINYDTILLGLISLLMLSIFPTIISIETINIAIKLIGSTKTAILGTLEPLSAIFFGVLFFGERLNFRSVLGIILILCGISFIVINKQKIQEA